MINQIIYSKEATYKFIYNGDITYEHHYIDNILNIRHRSYNDRITTEAPTPLNIKGTNQAHQVITPILVGERIYFEDESGQKSVELIFLLPDINYHVKMEYRRENELGQWYTSWGFPVTFDVITV